jgi:threonine/homoserine/homoserine lactone efflux protein
MSGDFIVATSALTIGGEILDNIFSNQLVKLCLFSVNIIILGYLGLSTLFQSPEKQMNTSEKSLKLDVDSVTSTSHYFFLKRYVTGLSLVLSSPWSYLWWVSAGTIILFGDFNVSDFFSRLAIVLMFLSGIFIWIIFFCTLLALIGRSPNPVYFKWITKGTAVVLLLLIIIPAVEAWETLIEVLN